MDQLMPIGSITTSKLEESNFPTYSKNVMTNSNDEEKTTPPSTPRFAVGSNDMNLTSMEFWFRTFESEHLLH